MSHSYQAVGWNRQKKIYDGLLLAGVAFFLLTYIALSIAFRPNITIETLLIRAFGSAAFLLLHVILAIGPLCRLDARFLPLLYNRRHMGVTMFVLALTHAVIALVQFHTLGDVNPLVSMLAGNNQIGMLSTFPFQPLGFAALIILFLMAATSHDFWLANLTAPVWKALHMLVYVAYALLVAHVALGALQSETEPALAALLGVGLVWIFGLHLLASLKGRLHGPAAAADDNWQPFCGVDEIPDGRAFVAAVAGERVAVFRYGDRLSALSSVCQHQNGPLGEGCVIDGLVTCPWHGYQYDPETGASPPPFNERVPTFRVKAAGGQVFVDPRPNPAGTRVAAARVGGAAPAPKHGQDRPLYVGYQARAAAVVAAFLKPRLGAVAALALLTGVLLALGQKHFDPAFFEFGTRRVFSGVVSETPYPTLLVERPAASGTVPMSRYLLVLPGKHGAADLFAGLDGRRVTLRGTLIYRDDQTMVEVQPGSVSSGGAAPHTPLLDNLGRHTLRGEIIDSKCYLGVMNPGYGKVHRACAIRCISGGIPPLFVVRDEGGNAAYLLLAGGDGRALNKEVLDMIAEPLEITGQVIRRGGDLVLRAEPDAFTRLSSY